MAVEVAVLGPIRVSEDGESVELERPSHRRLLSILALESGDRVSTETLIDRFWDGHPPATAKAALQTHVSTVRKIVGADTVSTEGYGYRLAIEKDHLDRARFEAHAKRARKLTETGDWGAVAEETETALSIWRGKPFEELRDDEFARATITRLEETNLEMHELRARSLLELGRPAEALPELEGLVVDHPFREQLWEHLMTARYRLGRNAEALRAFQEVSEHLASIGVEPGEDLRRLEERILLRDSSLTEVPHNLPKELDEFVGREEELERVGGLIVTERLVTLTGAGGSGKTRLAVKAARQHLDEFPDGVWFVDLAPVSGETEIPSAIARAIGLKPSTDDVLRSLLTWLAETTALIILDNCEHLLEAAGLVAEQILLSTDEIVVLATSRGSLGISGEHVYEVPGLSTGEHADAVTLFLTRASKAGGAGRLAAHDDSIVDICRRLDGMPLAIEFAAARTRSLAPSIIAERLEDRFQLLIGSSPTAPPRHRTLEATLDWSYQLLSREEQALLRRLSVFRGGFTTEMAEKVCSAGDLAVELVVPTLSSLVDKSLVVPSHSDAGPRYRLLETVAAYGRRLMADAELSSVVTSHLEWATDLSTSWHLDVLQGREDESYSRLDLEVDNLWAAIAQSAAAGQLNSVGPLRAVLGAHHASVGLVGRAIELLGQALEDGLPTPAERYWRARYARLLFDQGRIRESLSEARQAAADATTDHPSAEGSYALRVLSHLLVLMVDVNPRDGIDVARDALTVAEAAGEAHVISAAHTELGWALAWNGETKAALESAYRSLEMARQSDSDVKPDPGILDIVYLDPDERREGPIRIARDLEERWGDIANMGIEAHWLPWIYAQAGEMDNAEKAVAAIWKDRREGYFQIWQLMCRATVNWMVGRLEGAQIDVRSIHRLGPNPRWYHDFYPLFAEVHADLGDLGSVRNAATEYLEAEVHTSEEAKKLGVLHPLVRAEIDAFRESGDDHLARASQAVELMRSVLTEHPPPTEGSVAIETHSTHLAFAEAELSRATESDPELWAKARDKADYTYYRLYAQWRLGEALMAAGLGEEGEETLREALARSRDVGTGLLTNRMRSTADEFELDLG